MPALIDTGSSISVIPNSIAEGIGYTQAKNGEFSTVSGKTRLKIITIKKLSFLNINFHNIEVAINKKKTYAVADFYQKLFKKEKEIETAIIGMSELSKTNFAYKNGVFTICR